LRRCANSKIRSNGLFLSGGRKILERSRHRRYL
jgi:hypothetical protein